MKLCLICNFQFGDEQELCPKDMSKLVPVGKDPLIGMLIQDRYRIESLVAKGSMGVVYRAMQEAIGRPVAIKVMHGYLVHDDESMKRYHKEAKAASRLNHPNITSVYDFGVLASGQPYIVMDLLVGKSLAEILQQRGQLTTGQTMMVFNQVCQALAEAHSRGVVHRDIKPENIVIEELPDGKNINVKVVDFGIATFSAETEDDTIGKITKTGTVCGSPFYMSPEQCDAGKVDARSDLYSLGIVLFECLTGKVPFESKDIYTVLTMQVKEPPPRLSKMRPELDFSNDLELFVAKTLSKEPSARFQSAQQFWEGLFAASTGGGKKQPSQEFRKIPDDAASASSSSSSSRTTQAEEAAAISSSVAAATEELITSSRSQRAAVKQEKEKMRRRVQNRGVSGVDRFVSIAQIVVPPVLSVIMTVALFWIVANQAIIHSIFSPSSSSGPGSVKTVESLIAQGKLEEARTILEMRRKDGAFSENDQENLDITLSKLAKREARAKHYKKAAAYLEQLSDESKDDEAVKALIRRYKKMASK